MASPLLELADDLTGLLNDHDFGVPFTAGRALLPPDLKLEEAEALGLRVRVIPHGRAGSRLSRAEWQYDSEAPEQNAFYWYEGQPSDYRAPDG